MLGYVLDETFGEVAAQVSMLYIAIQVFAYDIEGLWRQIRKEIP